MKKIGIDKKSIYYFLLLVTAASIPFPIKTLVSVYAIIALGVSWIILGEWKNKWLKLRTNKLSFLFFSYSILLLAGFIYSDNKREAEFILEKNIAMLLFPLFIISGPEITEKKLHSIAKAFILGCLGISFIALLKAVHLTYLYGNKYLGNGESYFYYKVFGELLGVHMSYFSLYCSFSVFLISIHTYYHRKKLKTGTVFIRLLLSTYFLVLMYLLSTRMAYIAFFAIGFSFALYYFYKNGKLIYGAIILPVLLVSILYIFSNLWHTRMRFYYMFHPNTTEWKGAETRNEILNRKVHWGCYLEAITSSNMLFGVGTGDSWNSVEPCYKRWDFHGWKAKYNAHNQYLETMLRHGAIGLSIWLACLIIPFWISIKRKYFYYAIFLALFAFSGLTETMLDRQHGVVFYAFFNAVLYSFLLKASNYNVPAST